MNGMNGMNGMNPEHIRLNGKKAYFLSDVHLGASALSESANRERERRLVGWMEQIRNDCAALFLLGDIFDFWFEYKRVVPKGSVRFLAKVAEFTDQGIPVCFFTGNHDVWLFDYLNKECGVRVFKQNTAFVIGTKKFYLGHGDGLDPHDKGYLFIRRMFHNRFLQRCFRRLLHPDLGVSFARRWSSHSRKSKQNGAVPHPDGQKEIENYARRILQQEHFDYFLFGHLHTPSDTPLGENSRYINTGDWITHFSYAVFDGHDVRLVTE
ncbi:MAG: UDP-2,3-diacylglucosamine diphosphatase [Culturomica sp.]|jgi:UDP-2,3-diacylglucosamine hydrolase|nr:UDP-2,3-diacylglucosamine diphosphatase [Culturomica sp.]